MLPWLDGVCIKKHRDRVPRSVGIHDLTPPPGPPLLHVSFCTRMWRSVHLRSTHISTAALPSQCSCPLTAFFTPQLFCISVPLLEAICLSLERILSGFVWKRLYSAFICNDWFAGVETRLAAVSLCALKRSSAAFPVTAPHRRSWGPKLKVQTFLFGVFNGRPLSPQKQSVAIWQSQSVGPVFVSFSLCTFVLHVFGLWPSSVKDLAV